MERVARPGRSGLRRRHWNRRRGPPDPGLRRGAVRRPVQVLRAGGPHQRGGQLPRRLGHRSFHLSAAGGHRPGFQERDAQTPPGRPPLRGASHLRDGPLGGRLAGRRRHPGAAGDPAAPQTRSLSVPAGRSRPHRRWFPGRRPGPADPPLRDWQVAGGAPGGGERGRAGGQGFVSGAVYRPDRTDHAGMVPTAGNAPALSGCLLGSHGGPQGVQAGGCSR